MPWATLTLVALASSAWRPRWAFLAAYGMARRKRRLNLWLQLLLMAPIAVSYLIIAMGLLIVFNWLGISRSLLAVGIGHVVINLPLCFAIVYSQLGEHQANIERAAHDLGASDLKALLLITVPMIGPPARRLFLSPRPCPGTSS